VDRFFDERACTRAQIAISDNSRVRLAIDLLNNSLVQTKPGAQLKKTMTEFDA
jgi:hypothetical protein